MTWLVLISAGLLGWLWWGPTWRGRSLPGVRRPRPWLLGHRGMSATLPENGMAAFEGALDAGLDGLETDVQRSADGQLVLVHDLDFEVRGTGHHGALPLRLPVDRATTAELRAAFPQLTLLHELLALMRAHPGTLLNVEMKTQRLLPWRLAWQVAEQLGSSGMVDSLLVSSFNPLALLLLRLRAPRLRTAYLWSDHVRVPAFMRHPWPGALLHVDAMHPHHGALSADQVRRWQRRGLLVNAWTVNEAEDVRRVRQVGVDGIMADDPHALLDAAGRTAPVEEGDDLQAGMPVTPPKDRGPDGR